MSKLLNAKVGDDLLTFNQPIEKIEKVTTDYNTITAYKSGHVVTIRGDFNLKTLNSWTTLSLATGFPKALSGVYANVWLAHNLDNMYHSSIGVQINDQGELSLVNWGKIDYTNAIAIRFSITYISSE